MFWTIIQTIILASTAGVVAWYTWETHRTRKEMVRQTELGQTPFVIAWCRNKLDVYVVNVGKGTALNFRLLPVGFDESDGEITDAAYDSLLTLAKGAKVGFDQNPAKLVPYLLPQSMSDEPIWLEIRPPEDDRPTADHLLKNVNGFLIRYQDVIGRHFSKIILLDPNGDYLRQVDYERDLDEKTRALPSPPLKSGPVWI